MTGRSLWRPGTWRASSWVFIIVVILLAAVYAVDIAADGYVDTPGAIAFLSLIVWGIGFAIFRAVRREPAPAGGTAVDTLAKLAQLKESGAISQEEFDAKKSELLRRL